MATGGSTSSDDPGEVPVSVDSCHVAVVGTGPNVRALAKFVVDADRSGRGSRSASASPVPGG
jgi:hypothetical protein